MTRRLQQFVGYGLLALVALMPLHAFLTTWLGTSLGHRGLVQGWKELVIGFLGLAALATIWQRPTLRRQLLHPINLAVAAYVLISILTTLAVHPSTPALLNGLKIDLEFLIIFIIAQVAATRALKLDLAKSLTLSSGVVILFGLLQIFVLAPDVLTHFGYSHTTIEPYLRVPGIDSVRILSTLGGPNQLGEFLIIPICLAAGWLLRRPRWWHAVFLIGAVIVLWHSYSRSAWLGAIGGVLVVAASQLRRDRLLISLAGLAVCGLIGLAGVLSLHQGGLLSSYLLHGDVTNPTVRNSSREHVQALESGISTVEHAPFGSGLGSAGPASYYSAHPQIPENYYLQVAIEGGVLGLAAFLTVLTLLARRLWQFAAVDGSASGVLGALAGLSIVCLFLHGWADSSTALVFWTYAGVVVGARA